MVFTFPLFKLPSSVANSPGRSGPEDGRRLYTQILQTALDWLFVNCEICYFLIAQTSLFSLLSADGKRYEQIIKVLINARGIFSVSKLAVLNRSSRPHWSAGPREVRGQPRWVRRARRGQGGRRAARAHRTLPLHTLLSGCRAALPFVLLIFNLLMEPFTPN